ncbi:uncharacterized protein LOC123566268 [Mercenaria mercenaria]|uniref:uncharacterized protein LOC123566268 n=1 Tax=Mercenaria mercenaria TaxID=6596 RepID=UPI00234FA53F|nr:uncharacterized protein LOC123566268 [Mercenaria mercenaria]
MKKVKYNVVVVYSELADVLHAACECPAGLGPNGEGKCNHIGGLLFCVEDFSRKCLQKAPEAVTCTGKLSSWNVPRDLKVSSAELPDMKIKKLVHRKRQDTKPSVTLYDPCAPVDHFVDVPALRTLYDDLEDCMPASGFFLFHDDPEDIQHEEITLEESILVSENVEVTATLNYCESDSAKKDRIEQNLVNMFSVEDINVPENMIMTVRKLSQPFMIM